MKVFNLSKKVDLNKLKEGDYLKFLYKNEKFLWDSNLNKNFGNIFKVKLIYKGNNYRGNYIKLFMLGFENWIFPFECFFTEKQLNNNLYVPKWKKIDWTK